MKNSIENYFIQTYGIGKNLALKMSYFIGVDPAKPASAVADFKKEQALSFLKNNKYITGFQLKNKELNSFIYYKNIANVKSYKFRAGLPIRGQRNKTNAKTARKNSIAIQKQIKKSSSSR